MMKNECEIVKDLLPNYIENQVSSETKEFIENHIKNCKECSNMLNFLKEGQNEEEIKEKNEKDINFLKKYNRKMVILKTIAIILTVFIIAIWVILCVTNTIENQAYAQGGYALSIIGNAYENREEIEHSDNYSLIKETRYIDSTTDSINTREIIYKNGRFKEKCDDTSGNIHYINYGILQEGKIIAVQYENDEENHIKSDASVIYTRYDRYDTLDSYYERDILECSDCEVDVEEYDGIEYYIVRDKGEDRQVEIWVRKDDKQLYKIVTEKVGQYKKEEKFTWTVGNITDEDLKIDGVDMEELEKELQEGVKSYGNI